MSTLESCRVKISEMESLLDAESKFLRTGRLEGLVEMSSKKLKAMSLLEASIAQLRDQDDIDALSPKINEIRKRAENNGVVLKAVLNGVKAAGERLKSLRHSEAKVGAYNRAGTKLFLAESQIISEKRI